MEPLWFSCGIRWKSNSCLLEQLQSGSQSCADKEFHRNAFLPFHIVSEQDALLGVMGGDVPCTGAPSLAPCLLSLHSSSR